MQSARHCIVTANMSHLEFVVRQEQFTYYDSVCPYERVVGIRTDVAWVGSMVGGDRIRSLDLDPVRQRRIFEAFVDLARGNSMNCLGFARRIYPDTPGKVDGLPEARGGSLKAGNVGLVAVSGFVEHWIALGSGRSGQPDLQVMSRNGELGFAVVRDVLRFYRDVFSDQKVRLHEWTPDDLESLAESVVGNPT